jgi:hypothetical protein
MEFVAPDRYRVTTAHGPQSVIVGDTMDMDMGDKLTPVPVPGVGKMVAQYRNPHFLREVESGMTVQSAGNDTIDGEAAKVHACTVTSR